MNLNRLYSFATAAIAAATLAVSAHADLLSGNEVQLETWLGQGDMDFTNIFTKQADDGSIDFHAKVDGKGATFTLVNAYTLNAQTGLYDIGHLLGGYNPLSWSSTVGWNMTPSNADRTAFLFNLSSSTIQRQNLIGFGATGSGEYQTYYHPLFGPLFGSGYDLYVDGALAVGFASNYSYGGTSYTTNLTGAPNFTVLHIAEIEVYTVAPATTSVPDTAGTLGLLGISMLGLVAFRRRITS